MKRDFELVRLRRSGASINELAQKYNLSAAMVSHVIKKRQVRANIRYSSDAEEVWMETETLRDVDEEMTVGRYFQEQRNRLRNEVTGY